MKSFFGKYFRFVIGLYLTKCKKQIKYHKSTHATISKLPFNKRTMEQTSLNWSSDFSGRDPDSGTSPKKNQRE